VAEFDRISESRVFGIGYVQLATAYHRADPGRERGRFVLRVGKTHINTHHDLYRCGRPWRVASGCDQRPKGCRPRLPNLIELPIHESYNLRPGAEVLRH